MKEQMLMHEGVPYIISDIMHNFIFTKYKIIVQSTKLHSIGNNIPLRLTIYIYPLILHFRQRLQRFFSLFRGRE